MLISTSYGLLGGEKKTPSPEVYMIYHAAENESWKYDFFSQNLKIREKGSFFKNKVFGGFFGDIHIIKVSITMKASGVTSSFFRAKFFSQFILVL